MEKNHNDNSIMHIIHIYTYIYIHSENHKTVDEEDDLELNFFECVFVFGHPLHLKNITLTCLIPKCTLLTFT